MGRAEPPAPAASSTSGQDRQSESGSGEADRMEVTPPSEADESGNYAVLQTGNQQAENDSEMLDDSDDPASDIAHLSIRNTGSPSPSSDSHPEQASSSTVPPVDILSRKPVARTSSHLGHDQNTDRDTRTPSPSGLPSSLNDTMGAEGPMTPRNDVGPFVFDGSGGRISSLAIANTATASTSNSTSAQKTPQNEPQE